MPDHAYVFASSKPWHRSGFESLRDQCGGEWHWVGDSAELGETARRVSPRFIFFLHWNWKVPDEIWTQTECVCFHMTDVPYGRGGSPLQNLIKAGHRETKLSALRMVREMDAGPVYIKKSMSLAGRAQDIYQRAGNLSYEIIRWLVETEPTPADQQGSVVTFRRRRPSESELPMRVDIEALYDHIRMLDAPTYPHAFFERDGYRYEFTEAELCGGELRANVVIKQLAQ